MLKKLRIYKTRLKKVTFDGPLPPSLVYTETEQILGMIEPNIELFYLLKPYGITLARFGTWRFPCWTTIAEENKDNRIVKAVR